jgi:hypothetical protein
VPSPCIHICNAKGGHSSPYKHLHNSSLEAKVLENGPNIDGWFCQVHPPKAFHHSLIAIPMNGTNGTSVSFSWMANFVISSQSGDQP